MVSHSLYFFLHRSEHCRPWYDVAFCKTRHLNWVWIVSRMGMWSKKVFKNITTGDYVQQYSVALLFERKSNGWMDDL